MNEDDPQRLQALFDRYYAGQATPAEQEELMRHIRAGQHDQAIEEGMKRNWLQSADAPPFFDAARSRHMLGSILASGRQRRHWTMRIWVRYAAVAAVLAVVAGMWVMRRGTFGNLPETKATIARDVAPGGNKALLTLADGKGIELDRVGSGLVAREGNTEITKQEDGLVVYNSRPSAPAVAGFNKVSTPRGGQYKVQLPDGSKVWLNASSSIRFPSVFPASERRVAITGEAYFEVTKDRARPFTVSFNGSEVQVLGTRFNVMAYADERVSKTTLVEGSVSVRSKSGKALLRPGQQASLLPGGDIQTAFKPVEEAVAWKEGMFYFKNAGVRDVMRQLSRWYDVEVTYRGEVPVREFTGRVSRQVNLSELVGMLRYAGVNCRLENNAIVIEP
ncbi:MAG: iron dicitrate transport regulator FecR [Dyadobacter sp. 50-39]|uniref:FecR family protein n=1 Tax=Dyadobacter sp. 50-39 TaxID=1895756 RepID=UPI00095E6093|nr:FecR family protein [Dyadobacter sp. 50-39]OJV14968.1 MAG: iron dicitrate transport regulator FecR [Dyadobacter sp. 50-39]